jgi:hypothetical protein
MQEAQHIRHVNATRAKEKTELGEFITECTMQGKYFSMSQRSDGPGQLQFSWL